MASPMTARLSLAAMACEQAPSLAAQRLQKLRISASLAMRRRFDSAAPQHVPMRSFPTDS
jgi:hypothetical protein